MRLFVLPARVDWESYESQFVTLAIDFSPKASIYGATGTFDGVSAFRHTKRTAPAKRPTEIFLSGTLSYGGDSHLPRTEISRQGGQEKAYRDGTLCALSRVAKARNGYPRRR